MEIHRSYWIIGVMSFGIAQFGVFWTFSVVFIISVFLYGAFLELFSKTDYTLSQFKSHVYKDLSLKPGMRKLIEKVSEEDDFKKIDKRLTGAQVIDENLQEIIDFLQRDFVSSWYEQISAQHTGFLFSVRESIQKIVINIAGRIKDVAWIPYLTTRLVDDAASHLRLYRLASERIKIDFETKKPTPQSLASFKSATQGGSGGHSRNSSDGGGKIATSKSHSRNNSISEKAHDVEVEFFRIEAEQENNSMRHSQICTNREAEKLYLENVVDVILFLALPPTEFQCLPFRTVLREVVIGGVLCPLIDMVSDPDFINRCFVWLSCDVGLTSEAFLSAVRATISKDELLAVLEILNKEILFLRGRDSGGGDSIIRQQLSSLMYVKKCIEAKLQGSSCKTPCGKLLLLPLTVILKHNLALSYFIDFLSTIDMQNYLFFYLSVESWRSSVRLERQKTDSSVKMTLTGRNAAENLREAAASICQQYLSDQVPNRVRLDVRMEEELMLKLSREPVRETWFDDLVHILLKKLSENYLPAFQRSNIYLKLMSDLELDTDPDDEPQSPDNVSLSDSLEDEDISEKKKDPQSGIGKFQLKVEIIDSGVVLDRGKTYGIYALSVVRIYENGFVERWHVYRRYSDFYDLQNKVKDAYSDLGRLPFPGKKAFNNMDTLTLTKRMKMLNDYLQILLHSGVAETHPGLTKFLLSFLEPAEYDKAGTLGSTLESVVSPIRSSMRTVGDNLFSTVDGLSRSLQPGRKESPRTSDENVPLRIMLLLMDQVFDLQSRNQWLRRRIVALLRQMFGDIVNRKILNYVEELTGAPRVAMYLSSIKDALWPNGVRAASPPKRDEEARLRTKVVARTALLSALTDDIKHLLGSETTRRGLLGVFNTFQHPGINRRLIYVFLEGVFELLFPPIADVNSNFAQSRDNKSH